MNALQDFIAGMDSLVITEGREAELLAGAAALMRRLIGRPEWLHAEFSAPHPAHYQQFLLHADPRGRYSVVSFVWGPGQRTPIHDHGTWGVIGMLRGAETSQAYRLAPGGRPEPVGTAERLEPGDVALVSPTLGDIHLVRNAYVDRVSISIHAYGVDIGKQRRRVFDPVTGVAKGFVSGYANANANANANASTDTNTDTDAAPPMKS